MGSGNPEVPLELKDYINMYLGYLIIPAIYVILFAIIPIRKLSKNKKISAGFFITPIILGALLLFIAQLMVTWLISIVVTTARLLSLLTKLIIMCF